MEHQASRLHLVAREGPERAQAEGEKKTNLRWRKATLAAWMGSAGARKGER
jgi:hypothetical protein